MDIYIYICVRYTIWKGYTKGILIDTNRYSDARFAINCQYKMTLELILKAPMCVYNMN